MPKKTYRVVHEFPILVQRIQDVLSPNLLDSAWQELATKRPLAGYCYIASEALYHMAAKEVGYKPARMYVHIGNGVEVGHWFLRDKDWKILDITASQFGKVHIPYQKAVGCGFLTKGPSGAAFEVLRRVEEYK